jgi:hypothetical protein
MKKNRNTLLFTKTDIANILNVSLKTLERTMTVPQKGLVSWDPGRQTFNEAQALPILSMFLTMNTPQKNMELLRKYAGRE